MGDLLDNRSIIDKMIKASTPAAQKDGQPAAADGNASPAEHDGGMNLANDEDGDGIEDPAPKGL